MTIFRTVDTIFCKPIYFQFGSLRLCNCRLYKSVNVLMDRICGEMAWWWVTDDNNGDY